MSGFEVAGLVLGIIPLVISGLEHYAEGVEALGRYRKYKYELRTLIDALDTEKCKLVNVCDRLLNGIVNEYEIEDMVEDPFGEKWKNEVVLKKIRQRLYRDFVAFRNTIENIKDAIQEMQKRLAIRPDGSVKWDEGSALKRELRRATFSLRKSSYDDILTSIKDGISSLERIACFNIELEPKHRIRSQSRLLKLVRETSRSIYRALRSSLMCRGSHDLSFGLAARSADFSPNDGDEMIAAQFTFHIAISGHVTSSSSTSTISWEEIEVRETTPIEAPIPSPRPSPLPSPVPSSKKGKGKSVSFSWSVSTVLSATSTSTITYMGSSTSLKTSIPAAVASGTTALTSIPSAPLNLCQTLFHARSQPVSNYCGCIVDSEAAKKPREFGISLATRQFITDGTGGCGHVISSAISLQEVLQSKTEHILPPSFSDRLYLASVISSSVLQLHRTPWLPDILSSDDILFVQQADNTPLYRHAFVVKKNYPCSTACWPANPAFAPRNPTVLSLGILLIELILMKPVRTLDKFGHPDLMADLEEAKKHLNRVDETGLQNYGTAVRRCLNYYSQDLEDDRFRCSVYSSVVALLEDDLSYVIG